jgi:hypothetical protein
MQLCFVSVHGPRETYFVDKPRSSEILHEEFVELHSLEYLESPLLAKARTALKADNLAAVYEPIF